MFLQAATRPLSECGSLVVASGDVAIGVDPVVPRITHDLRNVLQIISGNLAMLSRHAHDDSVSRTYIDRAMAGVDLGARLIGTLQSGDAVSRARDPLDLTLVLADIKALLTDAVGSNVRLRVEAADRLRIVAIDLAELESALLNLAINARDAMDGCGALTVDFRNVRDLSGPAVEIAVSDTGCGMAPDVLERAFEPFFSTKGRGGSGLGLATVNRFVQRYGGSIAVDSAAGRGTTVQIRLPAV
jgi:signal transduction histidine kinase